METGMVIKQYNIDYDFIISNYLDVKLWTKTWNLFVYRDNVFTLNLHHIDTKNERIVFEIRHNKTQWSYEMVSYDIKNMSIKILKQLINGAIFRSMEYYDSYLARDSDGYKRIKSVYEDEGDRLRGIAEEYLDDNGITLEDVREAYIDRFVSNNRKCDTMLSNYVDGTRYTYCTDMLLVFTKTTNSISRYNNIIETVGNALASAVLAELEEFEKQLESEDYDEELHDALEAI